VLNLRLLITETLENCLDLLNARLGILDTFVSQ